MGILWIVFVGFVAGIVARLLAPGPGRLATFIGQAVGWYRADQGAGFIAATVGAIVVLFIWNRIAASRAS